MHSTWQEFKNDPERISNVVILAVGSDLKDANADVGRAMDELRSYWAEIDMKVTVVDVVPQSWWCK